jgi:putative endonuclease
MQTKAQKLRAKPSNRPWIVYILRCRDDSLYTGITTDVSRRFKQHNAGTASKYTRSRLPARLVHRETHGDQSSALKREAAIKAMTRREKLRLVRKQRKPLKRVDAMIFRISQALMAKIKAGPLEALPLNEIPLADWSAQVFVVARKQYVLLSNTKTLFSTVMRGGGIPSESAFVERAMSGIRALLEAEGQMNAYERSIAPATSSVRFAKSLDRRVTGSMNELVQHATACLEEGELSQCDVGLGLNDILLSMLARSKSIGYGTPREALNELVAEAEA